MDITTLDWTSLTNIGSGAVVVFIALAIISGRLVPRRTMQDRMADKDQAIEGLRLERNDWKSTAQTQAKTISTLSHQVEELMETGRTTTAFIRGIQEAADRD